MSEDLDQRPAKRQRFFADDPNPPSRANATRHESADASPSHYPPLGENEDPAKFQPDTDRAAKAIITEPPKPDAFDADLFTSIVGEQLPPDAIQTISSAASQNVERAVNIYFDGSWKRPAKPSIRPKPVAIQNNKSPQPSGNEHRTSSFTSSDSCLRKFPSSRFLGTFGVGGWATRSGPALLKHGDAVRIERVRSQPTSKRGKGGRVFVNHKSDVLTRFTTVSGQEVGRLPKEEAEWVSTLIDQKVCRFEAVCVYSDEVLRVNDTIFLQLQCFMRREAFEFGPFSGMVTDDNRSAGLFEEKESTEEKNLRLRQVALVKLFDAIDMKPTTINPTNEKHKREGLLRAAEMAEQDDSVKKEKAKTSKDPEDSSEEEETQELEQDQLDTLYHKAQSFDFNMPEAQPAPTFNLSLRKYQKQALYWMLSKEMDKKQSRERSLHPLWEEYTWPTKDSDDKDLPIYEGIENFYVNPYSGDLSVDFPAQEQHCLGGILADEMGLGKTIEMLSLIHSHRIEPEFPSNGLASVNDLARVSDSPGTIPAPYTTLVIAPTSLLSQWESEALKASKEATMRVRMYYGADKSVNLRELCCASQRTTAPHVIVTSFGVVLSEFRSVALQQTGASGGLFSVEFFRIIIDEAHTIKNRRSKSARACYELKAIHRWVLTGTPIINRLEDLFSLVRFLKVEPWSNFSFWKTFITVPFESKEYARALNVVQSVLEPLVLRRTKNMKTPEGEPLVPLPPRTINIEEIELPEKEREIYDWIYTRAKRTYNDNMERGTLLQSYSTIFAQILRLRQTCCHPILTRNKDIVADEEVAAAAADATNEFKDDMDLQDLISQFTALTENPEVAEGRAVKFTAHALRQIQTESTGECPICCEEPMINPAVTGCWHGACKKCLEDFIKHHMDKGTPARCFNCRADIDAKSIFEVVRHPGSQALPLKDTIMNDATRSSQSFASSQPAPRISLRRINPLSPSAQTSAKIYSLLNHLSRIPPNTKSVVFSQFTSFLDLIGQQLDRVGVKFLRLDGSMAQKARKAVLEEFQKTETFEDEIEDSDEDTPSRDIPSKSKPQSSDASPTVLLISLKAGGVGLNLTTASNVFMMDPWWSFATEAQAIDRVHRMGQTRDVTVTRFIVKDSIEGRMLRVQERKMNIAGSLGLRVGGDDPDDDNKKERITELRMLFE